MTNIFTSHPYITYFSFLILLLFGFTWLMARVILEARKHFRLAAKLHDGRHATAANTFAAMLLTASLLFLGLIGRAVANVPTPTANILASGAVIAPSVPQPGSYNPATRPVSSTWTNTDRCMDIWFSSYMPTLVSNGNKIIDQHLTQQKQDRLMVIMQDGLRTQFLNAHPECGAR